MRIPAFFFLFLLSFSWLMAQEDTPHINQYIPVDVTPDPINLAEVKQQIGYPQAAIDSNLSGAVVVRVLVDEEGNALDHKIIKSPGDVLSMAVSAHIEELRFSPAMQGVTPVKYWVNVPLSFRLSQKPIDEVEAARDAIKAYNQKIAENPEDYVSYLQRGLQYRNLEEYEQAIEDFGKSIEFNPQKNKKKSEDYFYLFFAHVHRGKAQGSSGNWEQAKINFTGALRIAEESKRKDSLVTEALPNIYIERGIAHAKLGEYPKSMADYEQAITLDPSNRCLVHGFEYDIALSMEDYPTVVETLNELIACEPESDAYSLHYNRGYYKILAGQYEGAIADLDTVVQETNNIYLRLGALNQQSKAYRLLKRYPEALKATETAMQINVLHPAAYMFRGKIYLDMDKATEACKDFEKAIAYGIEGAELKEVEGLKQDHCE
jgi:TonB family protein